MSKAQSGKKKNILLFDKFHSPESIDIMSEVKTGYKNLMFGKSSSAKARAKISLALSSEKNPMFRKSHSTEAKTKIGEVNKTKNN
jgi:hypothetical protein